MAPSQPTTQVASRRTGPPGPRVTALAAHIQQTTDLLLRYAARAELDAG